VCCQGTQQAGEAVVGLAVAEGRTRSVSACLAAHCTATHRDVACSLDDEVSTAAHDHARQAPRTPAHPSVHTSQTHVHSHQSHMDGSIRSRSSATSTVHRTLHARPLTYTSCILQ